MLKLARCFVPNESSGRAPLQIHRENSENRTGFPRAQFPAHG